MRILFLFAACLPLLAGPREFGLAEFHAALAARGISAESLRMKYEVSLDPAQSWHIEPMRITGGDLRGLMYGLMEAAAQIRVSGKLRSAKGSPLMAVRGVRVRLVESDPRVWRPFVEMLARARINRLRLVGGEADAIRSVTQVAFEYGIEVFPKTAIEADVRVYDATPPAVEGFIGGDPIGVQRVLSGAAATGFRGYELDLPGPDGKYWLAVWVWGLAGFNPDAMDGELTAEFGRRFGESALDMKLGLLSASRVVSLLGEHLGPEPSAVALSLALHGPSLVTEQVADRLKAFPNEQATVRRIGQIGRFHGRRVLGDDYLRVYRETGSRAALQAAQMNFRGAARVAGEQKLAYTAPDLSKEPGFDTSVLSYPGDAFSMDARHVPAAHVVLGQTLKLAVAVPAGTTVTLHYQTGDGFQTATGKLTYEVKPTADAYYYFELVASDGSKAYLPDPLGAVPFFRVPLAEAPAAIQ